jgi:hypothetical protein
MLGPGGPEPRLRRFRPPILAAKKDAGAAKWQFQRGRVQVSEFRRFYPVAGLQLQASDTTGINGRFALWI